MTVIERRVNTTLVGYIFTLVRLQILRRFSFRPLTRNNDKLHYLRFIFFLARLHVESAGSRLKRK